MLSILIFVGLVEGNDCGWLLIKLIVLLLKVSDLYYRVLLMYIVKFWRIRR